MIGWTMASVGELQSASAKGGVSIMRATLNASPLLNAGRESRWSHYAGCLKTCLGATCLPQSAPSPSAPRLLPTLGSLPTRGLLVLDERALP